MKIEYKNINEALNFYNITDKEYKNKCYQCIENINKNNEILNKFNDIYKLLYKDKTDEFRKLWKIKNPKELFGQDYPIFGTNILLLLGYKRQTKNTITFDNEQMNIQKQRVKECLENDIIYKNYDEIRISQMLWGTYFINNRLIEVGRLQFESINDNQVKIHIPTGEKLDIEKVKKSIEDSKLLLKKYYNVKKPKYICESWLLSQEIASMLDENSNIVKFQKLFDIRQDKNGIDDILNFVFNMRECDNYNNLSEKTSLQRKIKEFLINGGKIYNGYGEINEEIIS